jgi:hypothetical protein
MERSVSRDNLQEIIDILSILNKNSPPLYKSLPAIYFYISGWLHFRHELSVIKYILIKVLLLALENACHIMDNARLVTVFLRAHRYSVF